MPARRYRLASPIDINEAHILYPPIILIRSTTRPHLLMSYNDAVSEKSPVYSIDADASEKSIETVSSSRWWLVLPCLLIMIFVSATEPLLLNDFVVRRYKRQYGLDTSSSAQYTACRPPTAITPIPIFYANIFQPAQPQSRVFSDYNLIEQAVSKFNVKNSIATLVPAFITFILFGANCDVIGRRPLLLIPFVGKVIRYSLMLIIVSRDLSDAWLITTHALEAAFGSQGLLMLSAFAYITDCTNASTRTRAFLLTEVVGVVVRIISMLGLGLWLHQYLYIVPISVYLALSVIGLLYVLFVQNESIESVRHASLIHQLSLIRLKVIFRVVNVFIKNRPSNNRLRLLLITLVTFLLLIMLFGYYSVFTLYMYGRPFCLDALDVAFISLAQAITIFILNMIAVFSKQKLDKKFLLPILGSVALIGSLILFGLAQRIWLLYIATCIGSLFFTVLPILRTKITNLVEVSEYAIVFVALGLIDSVGHQAISAVTNSIYNASVRFFPGLVFLVLALIGFFPITIMGYLALSK